MNKFNGQRQGVGQLEGKERVEMVIRCRKWAELELVTGVSRVEELLE